MIVWYDYFELVAYVHKWTMHFYDILKTHKPISKNLLTNCSFGSIVIIISTVEILFKERKVKINSIIFEICEVLYALFDIRRVEMRWDTQEYIVKRSDGKNTYKNLKKPYISISVVNASRKIAILFYLDYDCPNPQKNFRLKLSNTDRGNNNFSKMGT